MYEIGKIYRWRNQVGSAAYLNNTETTVVAGPLMTKHPITGHLISVWITDTLGVSADGKHEAPMGALAGALYIPDDQSGEKSILAMFTKTPELIPA